MINYVDAIIGPGRNGTQMFLPWEDDSRKKCSERLSNFKDSRNLRSNTV